MEHFLAESLNPGIDSRVKGNACLPGSTEVARDGKLMIATAASAAVPRTVQKPYLNVVSRVTSSEKQNPEIVENTRKMKEEIDGLEGSKVLAKQVPSLLSGCCAVLHPNSEGAACLFVSVWLVQSHLHADGSTYRGMFGRKPVRFFQK